MMLLLDRLITLPLLLPKPPVRILFSLLRRWRFLIPRLMARFVRRSRRELEKIRVIIAKSRVVRMRIMRGERRRVGVREKRLYAGTVGIAGRS
ncbi:hypothetical protein [Anaplasma phagocytophilum]|uniref:hypothetical protein n=1 Tax=Anaplasma phagocytophilum TaxID=948 RepID=UPI00311A98E4